MRGYREIGKTEQIIRIISLCHSKCRVSSHLLGDANAEHFVLLFSIKLIILVGVRVLTTYTQKNISLYFFTNTEVCIQYLWCRSPLYKVVINTFLNSNKRFYYYLLFYFHRAVGYTLSRLAILYPACKLCIININSDLQVSLTSEVMYSCSFCSHVVIMTSRKVEKYSLFTP